VAAPTLEAPGDEFAPALHARAYAQLTERGYVQYHPQLAEWVGGFKPGLMLGHALYWTHHWLARQPLRDGWFWKTSREWQDALGLSVREQDSARAGLRKSGLWHEKLQGNPARLFFRVDLEALHARAGFQPDMPSQALADLFGMPVMYFKPLADMSGGAAPGLVLSQLLGALHAALRLGQVAPDGYFVHGVEDTRVSLGLGTKVQRNARDTLRRAGILQEAWTQEQRPRLMVRLNLRAILACLTGQDKPALSRRKSAKRPAAASVELVPVQQSLLSDRAQVIGRDGNVTQVVRLLQVPGSVTGASARQTGNADAGGFRQSRVALLSVDQGLGDAKGCPFVETRVALLSNLYSKEGISKPPTTRARAADPPVDKSAPRWRRRAEATLPESPVAQSGDLFAAADAAEAEPIASDKAQELILPERLDEALHRMALQIAARAPADMQQAVLDELAGHMSLRKTINSPLGWLHSVVEQARAGTVTLTMADGVAAARTKRREREAERAATVVAGADRTATASEDADPDRVAKAQAKLRELRNEMAAKVALGGGGRSGKREPVKGAHHEEP
jgi:hypothetical protein